MRERFATEKATKEAMEAERRQMAALEKAKHDAEMRKIKAAETLQREWRAVVKKVMYAFIYYFALCSPGKWKEEINMWMRQMRICMVQQIERVRVCGIIGTFGEIC